MKKYLSMMIIAAVLVAAGALVDDAVCGSQIGAGIHYLRTVGDIKDSPDWNPDAVGFMASYRYKMPLIKIEGDLEWVPDYGGQGNTLFEPQAWFIVGGLIYGAGGIGASYLDGDWLDNPFYALRLGVDLTLFGLNCDVFGSYRFQDSKVLEDFNAESLNAVTFGLIVRLSL